MRLRCGPPNPLSSMPLSPGSSGRNPQRRIFRFRPLWLDSDRVAWGPHANSEHFSGARREDSPAQRKTPSKRALKRRSSCPGPVGVETRQGMGGGGHCGTGEIPSCYPCPHPILRRSALATRILQLLSNESTAGRIHLGPGATEHEGQAHLAERCLRQQRGMLAGTLAAAHACRQLRRPSMGR